MGCNSSKGGPAPTDTNNAPSSKPEETTANGQGQLIINEDTETNSAKETSQQQANQDPPRNDTPVGEPDGNGVTDGDVVVENVQQTDVKTDDVSSPPDNNTSEQEPAPATETTTAGDGEGQNLDNV